MTDFLQPAMSYNFKTRFINETNNSDITVLDKQLVAITTNVGKRKAFFPKTKVSLTAIFDVDANGKVLKALTEGLGDTFIVQVDGMNGTDKALFTTTYGLVKIANMDWTNDYADNAAAKFGFSTNTPQRVTVQFEAEEILVEADLDSEDLSAAGGFDSE